MTLVATSAGIEPDAHVLAAETATGVGPSVDFEGALEAVILLNVTEVSGTTPTLDVTIQESVDGVVWMTLFSFAQKTGAGTEVKKTSAFARFLRASWVITGTTPSFTFSLKANAKG